MIRLAHPSCVWRTACLLREPTHVSMANSSMRSCGYKRRSRSVRNGGKYAMVEAVPALPERNAERKTDG